MANNGFGVTLGNGDAIKGTGECKGVVLQLRAVEIVEDFLPFSLGNSDVILGVQWLEKLGSVTTNWKLQEMKFKVGKENVILKGDPSLEHTKVSLKAMRRTIKREGRGLLVELKQLAPQLAEEKEAPEQDTNPGFVRPRLKKYEAVFKSPQGLTQKTKSLAFDFFKRRYESRDCTTL